MSSSTYSLTLFTPAQYDAPPGMPFPGPPDTYPTKEQVAGYLNAYAAEFGLPVRLNTRVTALIRTAEGFEAQTDDGVVRARQVVVATGPSTCFQMYSRSYPLLSVATTAKG